MTKRFDLTGAWTFSAASTPPAGHGIVPELPETMPATVPGSVHMDLLDQGLIEDPYLGVNEPKTAWIGRTDWEYSRTFDYAAAEGQRARLRFDGLDTFATVRVNGEIVAQTTSQHVPLSVDITDHVRDGENTLSVYFDAPYRIAEARAETNGPLPNAYPEPFQYIRKTASNFGWDWGPTLVTSGIWRDAYLETWSEARLERVLPEISLSDGAGSATFIVDVERAASAAALDDLRVIATVGDITTESTVDGSGPLDVTVTVPEPRLWWPRGYGEQHRYDATVQLVTAHGTVLDSWEKKIGFRSVEMRVEPDDLGTAFTIVVNGAPVIVRGVNWIPDDVFPTRVGHDRYLERLTQAVDANVNLIRVWGGGNYESEEFYDVTDELGLLVAQDFLFACAAYPEDEVTYAEVEAEARANVARLASRPSLIMYCGGNETMWAFEDWGWKPQIGDRDWGRGYYMELLPRVVAEIDPIRPYWPNSPWSANEDIHPNDAAHGTMHIWDVWNQLDYLDYRKHRPRFAAEFGYQAPATYRTLLDAVGEDELRPSSASAVMNHHQKAADGDKKLQRGLDLHFGGVDGFDDWLYATQVIQARAVQVGLEHFRSLKPYNTGTILWQLNDCWPALSWAVIDVAGRERPSYFTMRRAYRDHLATFQPADDGGVVLNLINESAEEWTEGVEVRVVRFDGSVVTKQAVMINLAPRAAQAVTLDAALVGEGALDTLLVVDASGVRSTWFFGLDKDLPLPEADLDWTVSSADDGVQVTVEAKGLLIDLSLFPDRLDADASVDEAMVTLLPGEAHAFTVRTALSAEAFAELLTSPAGQPAIRTVNDLVTSD